MLLLKLFILTLLQLAAGFGILSLCRIILKPWMHLALSILLGIAFCSFMPFLLQLLYIPLTEINIVLGLVSGTLLLNTNIAQGRTTVTRIFGHIRPRIQFYEWPFLATVLLFVFLSVWRCYYLPPTPRDLTSGPEAIATYAVKEKTMINSLFTVDLETTNNQFKPAFIASLQIVYKYLGFRFGQLWLSGIFISFIIFLYQALNERLHKVVSGILLCAFVAIPEMYGYTFMALFDYSNAVYFCLGFYVLFLFIESGYWRYIILAGLLMGISTYIRSETLLLVALSSVLVWVHLMKNKRSIKRSVAAFAVFTLPALFLYWLSIPFYIHHYLPVAYSVNGLLSEHLFDLSRLRSRFLAMNGQLLFSAFGIELYGYFIYLFLGVLTIELLFKRRLTPAAKNWLCAVLIVWFGLPILGWLLPLMDLDNSTKRGLFKLFPLMLLFMRSSECLHYLSVRLHHWETTK